MYTLPLIVILSLVLTSALIGTSVGISLREAPLFYGWQWNNQPSPQVTGSQFDITTLHDHSYLQTWRWLLPRRKRTTNDILNLTFCSRYFSLVCWIRKRAFVSEQRVNRDGSRGSVRRNSSLDFGTTQLSTTTGPRVTPGLLLLRGVKWVPSFIST